MKLDICIKNGRVMDPYTGVDQVMDLAVSGGRIVEAAPAAGCDKEIDASGCYVFPGLVDYHVHVFGGGSAVAVRPDYLLATGVTSCVDAGTAGPCNFEAFYRNTVAGSRVRIKSYLNMYSFGQPDFGINEWFDVKAFRPENIRRTVERYRDNILGLKIRMSRGVAADREALEFTVRLAEELGTGVCVHVSDPVCPLAEMAGLLRPGDIFCHMYQDVGMDNILDANGHVQPEILKARQRGVIFDAANGRMNFNIRLCERAVDQGFWPDVISSDWLLDKYNVSPYAKNLMFIVSKYLKLGMPLMEALACVTSTPARLMGMEGRTGTLQPGALADIAIFRKTERRARHLDSAGNVFETEELFIPQMVICDGEFAFCQADFALC